MKIYATSIDSVPRSKVVYQDKMINQATGDQPAYQAENDHSNVEYVKKNIQQKHSIRSIARLNALAY